NYQRPALPLDQPWTLADDQPAPELELARMLSDYERTVAPSNKRQRLVFANLQKRLLSSIPAFYRTLSAHALRFDTQFADRLDAHDAPQSDPQTQDDDELDRADEAIEDEELERTASASESLGPPSQQARAQLD